MATRKVVGNIIGQCFRTFWIYGFVFFLILGASNSQKTYKRSCDCEYVVDGKCAYTLLLPTQTGGDTNGQAVCPKPSDTTASDLAQIRENITSLDRWSGDQAKMLSQLQSQVLSFHEQITRINSTVQGSSDCGKCTADISAQLQNQVAQVSSINQTLNQLVSNVNSIQGQLDPLLSNNQVLTESADKIEGLESELSSLRTELNELKRTYEDLRTLYKFCKKRGLLVSGPNMRLDDGGITASSSQGEGYGPAQVRIYIEARENFYGAWCAEDSEYLFECNFLK